MDGWTDDEHICIFLFWGEVCFNWIHILFDWWWSVCVAGVCFHVNVSAAVRAHVWGLWTGPVWSWDELPYLDHLDIYVLVLRVVYLSFFLIERWQFRRWQWRRRGERGARQQGLRECFEICSGGRRERHLQHMLARTHRNPASSFWQSERCVCKFHWFIVPPKMWLKSRFCVWQEPDTSDFLFSHNFNNRTPDSAINQWLHNPVPTPNQSAAFLSGPLLLLMHFSISMSVPHHLAITWCFMPTL